jgi:hypothetical protein
MGERPWINHRATWRSTLEMIDLLDFMVPGTGIEPARAEARRILSPLRLPVPPSRHFVEVLESRAFYLGFHIGSERSKCETV